MPDAIPQYEGATRLLYTPASGLTKGELIQLGDGRAAYADGDISSGTPGIVVVDGIVLMTKATAINILDGGDVFWDYSANAAHYKPVNDRDFRVGTAFGDASLNSNTMLVSLNNEGRYAIDVARDAFLSSITGTQGLNTMGLFRRGGAHKFLVSATNEAQKIDILSVPGFATSANAIIEAVFAVVNDGAGSAVDVSIGAANGTHATDADSITESLFVHLNANDTVIYAESDDGTVEVGATDTTAIYTAGSAVANLVHVWFDMRNPADVQVYVNGVNVLGGTVFDVSNATGPWFLLAHIEKTAAADVYELDLHQLRARLMEK